MSLARQLTMGTPDGRPRRKPQPGSQPEFVELRRLTARAERGDASVADALRAQIALVGAGPRMRPKEGFNYNDACEALFRLTGEEAGPRPGILPEPSETGEAAPAPAVPARRVAWDGKTIRKDRYSTRGRGTADVKTTKTKGPTHAASPLGMGLTFCGRRLDGLTVGQKGQTVDALSCAACVKAVDAGQPVAWRRCGASSFEGGSE